MVMRAPPTQTGPPNTKLRDWQEENVLLSPRLQLCMVPTVPYSSSRSGPVPHVGGVYLRVCLCTGSRTGLSRAPEVLHTHPLDCCLTTDSDPPPLHLPGSSGFSKHSLNSLRALQHFCGHSVTYVCTCVCEHVGGGELE